MYSGGTGAGKSGTPAALESRRKIEWAIAWVQGQLGVELDVERWLDPLQPGKAISSLYQTANRIAFAVWLRSRGVEAWLCHLLYLDDAHFRPSRHQPTTCFREATHERTRLANP